MQTSWRTDTDKLTFILCAPPPSTPSITSLPESKNSVLDTHPSGELPIRIGPLSEKDVMLGDINLFLYPSDEDEDTADEENQNQDGVERSKSKASSPPQQIIGEIEIMLASPSHRGKGLGKQALLTFLWYILSNLSSITSEYHSGNSNGTSSSRLSYLRVKISADNTQSIRLFESVGFAKVSDTPNYFGELELRRAVAGEKVRDIEGILGSAPREMMYL